MFDLKSDSPSVSCYFREPKNIASKFVARFSSVHHCSRFRRVLSTAAEEYDSTILLHGNSGSESDWYRTRSLRSLIPC